MKRRATFLRPSHIIHSHIKLGLQFWSFQIGACIVLVYLCSYVLYVVGKEGTVCVFACLYV